MILCFAHDSSFLSVSSLSPTSVSRHSQNFSTWRGFSSKGSAAMLIFWKCTLTKMRGKTPQILPNFASNCNILSSITCDVEGKQKVENYIVHQWSLAYTFTKFGRGRLKIGRDRCARLYGGGKMLRFLTLSYYWQPVFLFCKPIVSIHVCCLYIELPRCKLSRRPALVAEWLTHFVAMCSRAWRA